MGTWKGIIGASFTPDAFDQYCHRLHWLAWRPSFGVLHNAAVPSLAQRPGGPVKKGDFRDAVQALLVKRHEGEHAPDPPVT
ncbi:hypothetical protein [Hymenobacter ruricola]|uniref:Uncharacterized protein n=1 Tax=Hymenobacter ruricola TaxID=2791023 RepID=A0ABS0I925_9BACT|nr:hypothetical protein [Hymenobacter ruricola]MBF9223456.1 hypothetical protein [Hymenobacter ruricola]